MFNDSSNHSPISHLTMSTSASTSSSSNLCDKEDIPEVRTYHGNGVLKSLVVNKDGVVSYESWHENGYPEEQLNSKNGKWEGTHKTWYENGRPRMSAFYRSDTPEGEVKSWHENGKPKSLYFF